ncbi:MAG: YeeE/YedE thiosulfate transporter family protein [Myxococcales bacterium]|nr:YeeE/YedE thiosulfate transporter family protein [Myxococcales bacterium]
MIPILGGLLTGAAFGIVLYKVGASRFSRVIGMLTLRDTKVMKFAFTAIATASTLYGLASLFGVAEQWHLVPRVMPFLGSAHVLGGIIFGVAMGTTGTCPGTCIAKAGGRGGDKRFATLFSVFGLALGILAYAALKTPLTDAGVIATNQKPMTLHGLLGLPYGVVALGWGALFFTITMVVDRFLPEKHFAPSKESRTLLDVVRGEWSWLAGGILGGTVIVLATAQNGYLGFSGAALAVVGGVAHLVGHPMELVPKINDDILWRAMLIVGVFPGAFLASLFSTKSEAATHPTVKHTFSLKASSKALAGGFGLSLGAMIGGGCTTGAFIAAWPTLSVGSLAMGGTFFVASMATSNLLLLTRRLDFAKAQAVGDEVYD